MKFIVELGNANMRLNCKRDDVPWFVGCGPHKDRMVIVGGGPSVRDNLDNILAKKRIGMKIVACNAVHRILRNHGIEPDIMAFLDPQDAVADFIDDEPDKALYLAASTCHPSVFDKLKGRRVVMWHCDNGYQIQKDILNDYAKRPSVLIGGGGTITLRMLCVGHMMGYRTFHMYGIDSSFADDGEHHAYTKQSGGEAESGPVAMNGKVYHCTAWMAKQAEDFKYWYARFRGMGCKVHVHGTGLIPDIAKEMNAIVRERIAA